jgi:ubiquitin C-terminal hydrolase
MLFTNQPPNIQQVRDFVDKREKLAEWFTPNIHQDAQEFLSFLLEKFCQENPNFAFVRHYLFTIYRESTKYCNGLQHQSMKREIQHILQIDIENMNNCSITSLIAQSMNMKEMLVDERWKCPECNFHNSKSYESYQFYKLPNILIVQLKRYRNSHKHCTINNTEVEYDRYMTLTHKINTPINYELIGVVVFDGTGIHAGHYVAYILHSTNKWYLIDDMPKKRGEQIPRPKEVSIATVLNNKKLAYLFFYQKIIDNNGFMRNNIIDMVIDSFGKNIPNNNNTNNVAVTLKFPYPPIRLA